MDGRQLGGDDDPQAVRLANGGASIFAKPRGRIDDDELVTFRQKRQRVLNSVRRGRVKSLNRLRSIQHMKTARVLQQEALQQFGVKPVHIVNQLVKAILMSSQPETQGNLAESGVLIDQ